MEKEAGTNTNNENLRDQSHGEGDTTNRNEFHRNDYTGSDNLNEDRTNTSDDRAPESSNVDNTDKYLAMEQPGVTYTKDPNPTRLFDKDNYERSNDEKWESRGGNSEYSDAFNQDDYILQDNVDLDEDQNQSISSDDDDFEETNERY